ncbi:MAG: hypothetical protein HUJ76_04075 [Parasporobacterium sp.]|nr:hypothetical protein [Parasporobacterium sp.]
MKQFVRILWMIMAAVLIAAFFNAYGLIAYGGQTSMEFSVSDQEDDAQIYERYAGLFNGRDVSLKISGSEPECINVLRMFDFNSLDIEIDYEDEHSLKTAVPYRDLLFPAQTASVTVMCAGEEVLVESDWIKQLAVCLYELCPEAELNGYSAYDMAKLAYSYGNQELLEIFKNNARLNYILELALSGKLETAKGDPAFQGRLIFLIKDEQSIASSEAVAYKENFYDLPEGILAKDVDDADTAVFVYPVYSYQGSYGNGGAAVCTYTRVCVVDLNSLKMYEPYTAVKNSPPESISISLESGEYSTDGYTGEYEPDAAIKQIADKLGGITQNADTAQYDVQKYEELIPWYRYQEKETSEETTVQETTTDSPQETTVQETTAENPQETTSEQTEPSGDDQVMETSTQQTTTAAVSETAAGEQQNTETSTGQTEQNEDKPIAADVKGYSWLTSDMLDRIFEELGDETYSKTYKTIKNGANLAYGSKGDAALGLQKTLQAFGMDIKADSSIGNNTLEALNTVQRSLGLEQTKTLTSAGYALLMPALLMKMNEPAAFEMFGEYTVDDNENQYMYMKAAISFLEGSAYNAKLMYEYSGYGDYAERAVSCAQDLPNSGQIYRNENVPGTGVKFTASVHSLNESEAVCVKLINDKNELVSCLIIRGTGSASADIPEGRYRIIDGAGFSWYGVNDMFGEEGTYETMIFDDGSDYMQFRNGYEYTMSFNSGEHDPNSLDTGFEAASWLQLTE